LVHGHGFHGMIALRFRGRHRVGVHEATCNGQSIETIRSKSQSVYTSSSRERARRVWQRYT
jgi:hypothetical protein